MVGQHVQVPRYGGTEITSLRYVRLPFPMPTSGATLQLDLMNGLVTHLLAGKNSDNSRLVLAVKNGIGTGSGTAP